MKETKLNSNSTPTSVSGLETGDQLCQIDGEIVETKSQVTRLLRDSTSARHLEILLARPNKRVTIEEPPLDERLSSDNTVTSSQSPMKVNSRNRQTAEETLYLNLAEINQLMRIAQKLNSNSTPTSVSGLEAGDQLCQIDGEIVETKSQVTRLLRDSSSARHLEVLVARSNKRVTIEEPPLDERLSSDNTVTSSQSPMKVNSRNRQTAEETLYLNLAEINQLMRNGNSQALMNLADDPLCYQTSCDSTRDPQRSPYRRNPSARPMGPMPLSRQALQNMRQKSFTDDQWHNLPLSDKQKPRLPSGHHKNTQQNCGKYLDIARHGHSSRHGSVYGPIDHYQCHSAPHSPLHHSNDRSSNWEVRQSREKETSKLFDACTNNHFYHDNIPEKGNHGQRHHQHHQNQKYNLMKSSINDTFRRTSEVSAEKKDDHSGRKEKWGSLDCSTRRIRSSTLTGYELMYGRGGGGGPEEHQAVRENRVRHASANYSAVKTSADAHDNWTYEDKGFVVPLKSGIRREKTPDREGPRASFSEGRKGEGEKEGGLDRGRLTDEGQKKKIMSNYLVIRALLSTTEGNISEGASHPLLSINKV
ncbi:uncharacterized protein LOC134839729 [Symsagittifera roscoffensis]|uniref:uncharacterized protein LOC134839729 n=1 Tax=Symsagittifera roscoffensis TaxID=84072 RepID=UPI00307BFA8A